MKDLTGQANGVDSILDSEWNPFYQEFKNVIEDMVAAMDPVSSDQLGEAMAEFVARAGFYTGGGTAQAQTGTVVGGIQGITKLTNGAIARWRPTNNNTGAGATVNVNGTGAIAILHEDGSALVAGDLSTTRDAIVRYDGTNWRLSGATTVASSTAHPSGYIDGLQMEHNPADANQNQDVRVWVGTCRDQTNAGNMTLTSVLDVRWDAAVAIGASTGGYPSAGGPARAINTWYRFFLVGNTDGRVEAGWDAVGNSAATQLLADYNALPSESGWSWYRQLGWTRTAGAVLEFIPFDNHESDPSLFTWPNGVGFNDWETGLLTAATHPRVTAVLDYAAPETTAILEWYGFNAANSGFADIYAIVAPTSNVDVVPSHTVHTIGHGRPGTSGGTGATPSTAASADSLGRTEIYLDGARQFNARFYTDRANGRAYCNTLGFRFTR